MPEPGYYDVVMTVPPEKEGQDPLVRTLHDGFYYLACPGSVHLDAVGYQNPVAPGSSLVLEGCGLDPEVVTVSLLARDGTVAAAPPLVGDCSTAVAHVDVPENLAPGLYFLMVEHQDGTLLGGVCAEWLDTGGVLPPVDTDAGPVDTDPGSDTDVETGSTGLLDTGAPCDGTWAILVGGAP